MKRRVKVEHDKAMVFLTLSEEDDGEGATITVTLDSSEAQKLGEGLFRCGRLVVGGEPAYDDAGES